MSLPVSSVPSLELRDRGYVVLHGLIPAEHLQNLSDSIDQILGFEGEGQADSYKFSKEKAFPQHPSLGSILRDEKIRERLMTTIGPCVYAGNSSVKLWKNTTESGWHRDVVQGGRWREGGVFRIAVYCQPPGDPFQWFGVPGSHLTEDRVPEQAHQGHSEFRQEFSFGSRDASIPMRDGRPDLTPLALPRGGFAVPGAYEAVSPNWGDVIVFDGRLAHIGGPVKNMKRALFFALASVDSAYGPEHLNGTEGDVYDSATEFQAFLEEIGMKPHAS